MKKGSIFTLEPEGDVDDWPWVVLEVHQDVSTGRLCRFHKCTDPGHTSKVDDYTVTHVGLPSNPCHLYVQFGDFRCCAYLDYGLSPIRVTVIQNKDPSWLKGFMKEQGIRKVLV